jgi:hypothetical protein
MAVFLNGSIVFSVWYELNRYIKCSLILTFKGLKYKYSTSSVEVNWFNYTTQSYMYSTCFGLADRHYTKNKNLL